MTERASVFEAISIGVESTPGTEVDANKRLEAISLELNREGSIEIFRPDGLKFGTLATVGKEHTTGNISGILDYANLVYLLSSLVSYAAPVQQGATAAYLWTFTPDTDGPDTVKTFTVEQGSSVRAHQFEYGMVTGLEFSFAGGDSQISLSGSMIGQDLRDGITMTAAPTTVEAVPVHPKQATLKLATTQAGLAGASALTRVLAADWHYNDKFGPLFTVSTDDSFSAVVERAGSLGGSFTLEADSAGMAFLASVQAGTQYWIQYQFTGALIETSYYYQITLQMPIQFTSFPSLSDSDGVVAVQYKFEAVHDGTWGKALSLTVQNTLTGL